MRSPEEIEREILSLQSHVASLDLLIVKYNRESGESQLDHYKLEGFYADRDRLLRQIHDLEWVLGREPVL